MDGRVDLSLSLGDLTRSELSTPRTESEVILTKKHDEKAEWINNMTRELEGPDESSKAEIHIDLLKTTLKKYQTGKRQAVMEHMVSGSRIHLHS